MKRMKRMSLLSFLAWIILALVLMPACAGKHTAALTTTLKTLQTAQITYDTTMKAVADLYAQKKISEQDKATAIKYGKEFYDAYMIAVDALAAGKDQDISAAMAALSKLVAFVGQFTGGK